MIDLSTRPLAANIRDEIECGQKDTDFSSLAYRFVVAPILWLIHTFMYILYVHVFIQYIKICIVLFLNSKAAEQILLANADEYSYENDVTDNGMLRLDIYLM